MSRSHAKALAACITALLTIALVPGFANAQSGAAVSNPRIIHDSNMESGLFVTWDCVWFGSYPQTEITSDSNEYAKVAKANWNSNGDAQIGGAKYKRLAYEDTNNSENWARAEYHYFRYEPIKWRVLNVSSGNAFVMADVALDSRLHQGKWEDSDTRAWINGYGDYSSKGFINAAFTSSEQSAIVATNIDSASSDKIFFLSSEEVSREAYGFGNTFAADESRRCKPSDYAYTMGAVRADSPSSYTPRERSHCCWYLRDQSSWAGTAFQQYVLLNGDASESGTSNPGIAIRPAMHLNLNSSTISPAGTVTNDGVTKEKAWRPVASAKVALSSSKFTYTGKNIKPDVSVTYGSVKLATGLDYSVSYSNNKNAGTATVTISGKGSYSGTKKANFSITKANNPLTIKAASRTAKAKALKKKAVKVSGVKTVKKGVGAVTYTKVKKGSAKQLTVNKKTGKVTVKKGTKKGTYKVKIKVAAKGNSNYKSKSKTVTVKVAVK